MNLATPTSPGKTGNMAAAADSITASKTSPTGRSHFPRTENPPDFFDSPIPVLTSPTSDVDSDLRPPLPGRRQLFSTTLKNFVNIVAVIDGWRDVYYNSVEHDGIACWAPRRLNHEEKYLYFSFVLHLSHRVRCGERQAAAGASRVQGREPARPHLESPPADR